MDMMKMGQYLLAIDQLYELDIQSDLTGHDDPELEQFIYENDAGMPLATLVKLGYLEAMSLNEKSVEAILTTWIQANSLGLIDKYVAEEDEEES